jgi:predicted amino acid racemase
MSKLTINLDALRHNIEQINLWMEQHGATWTLVTKVMCGHRDTMQALKILGVRSIGDSRLENLKAMEKSAADMETWYLRLPHKTAIDEVVEVCDASLNSEIAIIHKLDQAAKRLGKTHRIIIMIEIGDLREGILPGHLVEFYEQVFDLGNIDVLGIGANLGCLAGAVPNVDQMMQLILYRELLELKFRRRLPMVSAGSTVVLPMLLRGEVPAEINHFRIGEAVFLGTDLVGGGTLEGLRDDALTLEAEVLEIKEKSLNQPVEAAVSIRPFEFEEEEASEEPGQRGYRAVVGIGQLDTDIGGLTPLDSRYRISGASSDLTVLNIGDDPAGLEVGGTVRFRMGYSSLLRTMSTKYVEKEVTPRIASFEPQNGHEHSTEVPPAMENIDTPGEPIST